MAVFVQGASQNPISSVISAYRLYKDIGSLSINVPTVAEVPFGDEFIERFDFAILDNVTNQFEPYYFKQETLVNNVPLSISTSPVINDASRMNDNNTQTYAEFLLPDSTQGQTQITISSMNPITSSTLTALLTSNVALPTTVEIRATVGGQSRIVVATRRMEEQTISFPQTTSNRWIITLTYGQPLRISELRLNQDNATKSSNRTIRFLAQPTHSYRIYFDPDRSVEVPVGEAGNLASAKDILAVPAISSKNNPNYIISDIDNDGVSDIRDNCVSTSNFDQKDVNGNGRGDVCDDFDQDGVINSKDNCPDNPNYDQRDADSDGIGDVCDNQESRVTERYAWLPWIGIGFAALVLIVLLILMVRSTPPPTNSGTIQ